MKHCDTGVALAIILSILKFTRCLENEVSEAYLGCFNSSGVGKDRGNDPVNVRIMPKNLTTENCKFFCLEENRLQYFGTTVGSRCYCWNSTAGFQYYGTMKETSCNQPCPGNEGEICGGRISISIYGDFKRSCPVISISNGKTTQEGSILVFTCKDGHTLKGNQMLSCGKASNSSKVLTWQGDIPVCKGFSRFLIPGAVIIVMILAIICSTIRYVLTYRQRVAPPRLPDVTLPTNKRSIRIRIEMAICNSSNVYKKGHCTDPPTATYEKRMPAKDKSLEEFSSKDNPRDQTPKEDESSYLSISDLDPAYSLARREVM